MQRRLNHRNVNLQQAITLLIQNQAAFLKSSIEAQERFARIDERFVRIEERLARIERDLDQIKALLSDLPEAIQAIRQKIGFKPR